MTITVRRDEIDTGTHVSNVRAFMTASLRFNGLIDQAYFDLLAKGVNPSLLQDLYPYDAAQVAAAWADNAKPWFRRRNRWDQLVHLRDLNGFANATLELQRYMPSLYLRDVVPNPYTAGNLLMTLMAVSGSLSDLLVVNGHRLMNPYVKDLLLDMFNAAAFLVDGGDFDAVYPSQVRLNSKATNNDGFEVALTNFFTALGRLIDMPRQATR